MRLVLQKGDMHSIGKWGCNSRMISVSNAIAEADAAFAGSSSSVRVLSHPVNQPRIILYCYFCTWAPITVPGLILSTCDWTARLKDSHYFNLSGFHSRRIINPYKRLW